LISEKTLEEGAIRSIDEIGWKQKVETNSTEHQLEACKLLKNMARLEGFEPPTLRSEV
jgi:hypothetical protein